MVSPVARFDCAWITCLATRSVRSYCFARARKKRPRRGDRRGEVGAKAGAAANGELTTVRLGLPAVSSCMRRHKGKHVHEEVTEYTCMAGASGLGQRTRGGTGNARAWRGEPLAAWLGWPVPARDRACMHENMRAGSRMLQHSHHRANRHHRGRRFGSPRRNTGELGLT
jgi:hypothetical protein